MISHHHQQEESESESEIKQLLAERGILDSDNNNDNAPRKDSTGGILATALRILKSMDANNNARNQSFFTLPELGRYDSGFAISAHTRAKFIEKAKKLGWVKEVRLPDNFGNGRKKFEDREINTLLDDQHTNKSLKRLRNTKFYKITDEGKRIYKNLSEVYEKFSSS